MRAQLLAGAAVLLGALAACGQSTNNATPANQAGSTSTTETKSTVPSTTGAQAPPIIGTPTVQPGATVLPKERLDTSGLPDGSLKGEVAVAPDGRSLTLTVMARDACSGVEATVTEETAQAVKILVTPMMVPQGGPPDQMCAQVLTPRQVTVQLKAPLGNRMVLITQGY